jgi:hypothetical protein
MGRHGDGHARFARYRRPGACGSDRRLQPGSHLRRPSLILVLAISVIDKLTGYDLQIGVLHAAPIALVTWRVGRVAGLAFAVLAGIFVAFVVLIGRLRNALRVPDTACLDKLSAPAYVVDAAKEIVWRNEAFRDALGERSVEELARYPAIESPIRWAGERRARLRILTV